MRNTLKLFLAAAVTILATWAQAAVNISDFSPKFGAAGDQVTIYGSGFPTDYTSTLVVKFGGVRDPNAQSTAANGTIIKATVPAGAVTGPISVEYNGSSASSLQDFVVIGPGPYVDSFSRPAGMAHVVLIGKRFYNPSPVTKVTFNGKNAKSFYVASDTQLQATPPDDVTTGPIKLTTALGTFQTSSNFFATPVLTNVSTMSGRAGTNVVIKGNNFTGALSVQFGGVLAPSFTVVDNQTINATAPVGVADGVIRVNAPGGSAQTTTNFVVLPTILGFSPTFGPVGIKVEVSGANFTAGTPVVKFNGVPAPTPHATNIAFGQVTVTVPAGATSGPLTVTTTNGSHTSAGLFYLPPVITSASPLIGSAGTIVLITGQNFTNASAVEFGGKPAQTFTVSNNAAIYAVASADVSSGKITVTTPGGIATSPASFYAPPVISLFSPAHGLPGTNVAIHGKNFLDATNVSFNGVSANFIVASNEFLTAVVPSGAQTGPISIGTPGGTNTSSAVFVLDYSSDLSMRVTGAPDPVWFGSNLIYTVSVTNYGPHEARNTVIESQLPTNALIKAVYCSRQGTAWTTNDNVLTASVGTLQKSQWATVLLTVVPAKPGIASFTATVESDYNDPVPANNSVTIETFVQPLALLDIRMATNRVRVAWPELLTNFVLQSRPNVDAGSFWSNVTIAPVTNEGQRVIFDRPTNSVRFYRLQSTP
jgi:uncharacterized repeat protein (TIGR01451 family)